MGMMEMERYGNIKRWELEQMGMVRMGMGRDWNGKGLERGWNGNRNGGNGKRWEYERMGMGRNGNEKEWEYERVQDCLLTLPYI